MQKGFIINFMSNVVALVLSTNTFAADIYVEQKDSFSQEIQLLKEQLNILNQKVAILETEKSTVSTTPPITQNTNPQSATTNNVTSNNNAVNTEVQKNNIQPPAEKSSGQSEISKEKTSTSVSSGKAVYQKTCIACHGENGKGIAPTIPDFTKKGGVLSQSSNILFNNVKQGIGGMPAKGGDPTLTDHDLKTALDYIENTFTSAKNITQTQEAIKQQPNNLNPKVVEAETTKPTQQALVKTQGEKKNTQSSIQTPTARLKTNPSIGTTYFWPTPDISGLIAGGASAGYSVPTNASGGFNLLDFNPLFLFRYKDLFFMQSSVDFSLDDDGNTNVGLNALNLNLFMNDYMVFGIGAFDSPLGYFVPNLSPSWINRLPTSPIGFEGGQAAVQSILGAELRGGFYFLSQLKMNYVAFVANGPRAYADSTTGFIDYIATDSFPNNYGNFIGGGRIGMLPIPNLEIGLSGAAGKLALFDVNTNLTLGEAGRDYGSLGVDLSFKWKDWDFRGEVTQQQIGAQVSSLYPQKENWKAWYLQAAYMIPATKLQPVVRWGGYTSAISSLSQHQVDLGLNYWFAPSIAVQADYEINTGHPGTNSNLFLIQLVFGF